MTVMQENDNLIQPRLVARTEIKFFACLALRRDRSQRCEKVL